MANCKIKAAGIALRRLSLTQEIPMKIEVYRKYTAGLLPFVIRGITESLSLPG